MVRAFLFSLLGFLELHQELGGIEKEKKKKITCSKKEQHDIFRG